MKIRILFILVLFTSLQSISKAESVLVKNHPINTVKSVKQFFLEGKIGGHMRNFFMSTTNNKVLKDHFANAIGFELNYETAKVKGFSLGIAGLFTFNTFSTKLDALDLLTNKTARLETELFDIEDPKNKTDLDRLDELFLNFEDEKFDVTLGRFTFNSPLINPQDGRMKPYSSQGINTNIYFSKKTTLKLAAFNNFSPRGTIKWYSIDDVLGIYTTGVNSDGTPSGYKGFTNSNVVVATGFEQHFGKAFKLNLWDYVIQNVSNTAYLKAEFELGKNFEFGFEAQHQNKISNGGNANTANAYFEQEKSFLYGSKIGFHKNKFALSLNYLRITDDGKFLFPREFGREQFFVTVPRGRLEGLSNASLLMLKSKLNLDKQWELELDLGEAWLPAFNNYKQNKYGATSYHNAVANVVYTPKSKTLEGLNFKLLYVTKIGAQDIPLAHQYYNVNFHNINFITQFKF